MLVSSICSSINARISPHYLISTCKRRAFHIYKPHINTEPNNKNTSLNETYRRKKINKVLSQYIRTKNNRNLHIPFAFQRRCTFAHQAPTLSKNPQTNRMISLNSIQNFEQKQRGIHWELLDGGHDELQDRIFQSLLGNYTSNRLKKSRQKKRENRNQKQHERLVLR